jgi:hypothetical protein
MLLPKPNKPLPLSLKKRKVKRIIVRYFPINDKSSLNPTLVQQSQFFLSALQSRSKTFTVKPALTSAAKRKEVMPADLSLKTQIS